MHGVILNRTMWACDGASVRWISWNSVVRYNLERLSDRLFYRIQMRIVRFDMSLCVIPIALDFERYVWTGVSSVGSEFFLLPLVVVLSLCKFYIYQPKHRTVITGNNTDMRRLTTGIRSEKCVVRRFRLCTNVYWHTHTEYSLLHI